MASDLFEIAQNQNFSHLNKLLESLKLDNFDVNFQNKEGDTLLHIITRNGHLTLTKKLLNLNANPNLVNRLNETSLHLACAFGNLTVIKLLLENKAITNLKDTFGETPIFKAVRNNHINVVKHFLNYKRLNVNITEVNNQKENILHVASQGTSVKLVSFLNKFRDLKINTTTLDGFTCLHLAVKENRTEIIKYLSKNGGNFNVKDFKLRSLLHLSVLNRNYDTTKQLLELSKTHLNNQDLNGATALHYTTELGLANLMNLLLENGADVNIKDNDGYTPLHVAASSQAENGTELVKILLKFQAITTSRTFNGDLPLHRAAAVGNCPTALLLNEKGFVNCRNNDHLTPLNLAVMNCHEKIVEMLLL